MNVDVHGRQPEFADQRTLVRHERGTLVVLMAILGLVIVIEGAVLYWLWGRERTFATPDIYQSQPVELHWGAHD